MKYFIIALMVAAPTSTLASQQHATTGYVSKPDIESHSGRFIVTATRKVEPATVIELFHPAYETAKEITDSFQVNPSNPVCCTRVIFEL